MGVKRNLDESGILDDSEKISEDEAALYDRQIRLWGVECQKRLREAKILVIGLNGVTAETVKNLTLSGVKQIAILDDREVTSTDFTAQFFLSSDKLGKPRAESSASSIRELNPNVHIDILSGDILSKPDHFYKDFHALVATDCSVDTLIKLNQLCREHGLLFYATDSWGFFGYCFLDLQVHDFKYTTYSDCAAEGVIRKKAVSVAVQTKCDYPPLEPTLQTKVEEGGLKKRVSKVFVLLHVVNNFREMFNRYPHPVSRDSDVEELKKLRTVVCEKLNYDASKITDEILGSLFGQLSPVCAAVGGVLANDIIKGIARNGLPTNNYFLFDGIESTGVNEKIGVK